MTRTLAKRGPVFDLPTLTGAVRSLAKTLGIAQGVGRRGCSGVCVSPSRLGRLASERRMTRWLATSADSATLYPEATLPST